MAENLTDTRAHLYLTEARQLEAKTSDSHPTSKEAVLQETPLAGAQEAHASASAKNPAVKTARISSTGLGAGASGTVARLSGSSGASQRMQG